MATCSEADNLILSSIEKEYDQVLEAKKKTDTIRSQVDGELAVLAAIPESDLPSLPDETTMDSGISDAKATVDSQFDGVDCVSDLTGSCLDGAVKGLTDTVGDVESLAQSAVDELNNLVSLPQELVDVSDVFKVLEKTIKSTGIDKLIKTITDKSGCLSGNATLDSILNDLSTITSELGLNPDGTFDETTFESFVDDKLTNVAGLPTSYKDDFKSSTTKINDMKNQVQDNAKSRLKTAKKSVSKLKVPSSIF